MSMHYSAARGGFFLAALHGALPADAVAITDAEHAALLEGQARGQVITADADGRPLLTDPPPPPVVVPAAVTRLQARLLLLSQPAPASSGAAHLWAWVEAWAAAPERVDVERAYWQDAQTWRRDDPLVAGVASALGLTAEDVDGLFIAAAAL